MLVQKGTAWFHNLIEYKLLRYNKLVVKADSERYQQRSWRNQLKVSVYED